MYSGEALSKLTMPVTQQQVEIAHDLVLMGEMDIVADKYGMEVKDIRYLMRQPEFKQVMSEFMKVMLDEVKFSIVAKASDAVGVVDEIMRNPEAKDRDRLSAAYALLDRAGASAKHQTDINIKNYNYVQELSDDELDELIIDITTEDVGDSSGGN